MTPTDGGRQNAIAKRRITRRQAIVGSLGLVAGGIATVGEGAISAAARPASRRFSYVLVAGGTTMGTFDAISANHRGYVAGKYGVELDEIIAGWAWLAELFAILERMGPDVYQRKHIAGITDVDITLTGSGTPVAALLEWYKGATADPDAAKRDATLSVVNRRGHTVLFIEITDAWPTEVKTTKSNGVVLTVQADEMTFDYKAAWA